MFVFLRFKVLVILSMSVLDLPLLITPIGLLKHFLSCFVFIIKTFEYTKRVIKSRKSKMDRQYNIIMITDSQK